MLWIEKFAEKKETSTVLAAGEVMIYITVNMFDCSVDEFSANCAGTFFLTVRT